MVSNYKAGDRSPAEWTSVTCQISGSPATLTQWTSHLLVFPSIPTKPYISSHMIWSECTAIPCYKDIIFLGCKTTDFISDIINSNMGHLGFMRATCGTGLSAKLHSQYFICVQQQKCKSGLAVPRMEAQGPRWTQSRQCNSTFCKRVILLKEPKNLFLQTRWVIP